MTKSTDTGLGSYELALGVVKTPARGAAGNPGHDAEKLARQERRRAAAGNHRGTSGSERLPGQPRKAG